MLLTPQEELLRFAVSACDESTQDPIDLAILTEARHGVFQQSIPNACASFPSILQPNDRKVFCKVHGKTMRVVKGAPHVVQTLCSAMGIALARMSKI